MANESQTLSTEEELKRLLELKKVPDSSLTQKQQANMDKLQEKYTAYSKLHADDMEKKLQHKPQTLEPSIQVAGNAVNMSNVQTNAYANKPGFAKPAPQLNTPPLTLQSEQNAVHAPSVQAGTGVVNRPDAPLLNAQHNKAPLNNTLQQNNQTLQQRTLLQHNNQLRYGAAALQNRPGRLQQQQPQVNQNITPRPLMTAPPSTVLMKNQTNTPKPMLSTDIQKNTQQGVNPQAKTTCPTPFKKKPFEQ